MRRRSRLFLASLLVGGSTCLGIALTSTSATPALSVPPAERSVAAAPAHGTNQNPSGATALVMLGVLVAGGNVVLGRTARSARKGA
jgi:hypothetical protein